MKINEALQNRVATVIKVVRSFMPWRNHSKTPTKGSLAIKIQRQWTPYSCTAAVAQMVARYYGIKLSHRAAIELAGCHPDGATLSSVAKALKKSHGLRHRALRKQSEVREALARGLPVMSNDALTYENNHAILAIGATAKGFWIADPLLGEVYWRHERQFFKSANEFIAVCGRN